MGLGNCSLLQHTATPASSVWLGSTSSTQEMVCALDVQQDNIQRWSVPHLISAKAVLTFPTHLRQGLNRDK